MISKADRIDGKGEVEGYYFLDSKPIPVILTHSKTDYADNAYCVNAIEIDPQTLRYSFDGVSWYSELELKELIYNGKLYNDMQRTARRALNND